MNVSGRIPAILASLADPSRYRVLGVLAEADYCVSEIATRVGLSQSCTTRHLQTLQRAGVLTRTRAGKRVLFQIREGDPELARVLELLMLRRPLDAAPGPARTLVPAPHARQPRGAPAPEVAPAASRTGGTPADAVTIRAASGSDFVSDTPVATDSPSDAGLEEAAVETASTAVLELEDFLL